MSVIQYSIVYIYIFSTKKGEALHRKNQFRRLADQLAHQFCRITHNSAQKFHIFMIESPVTPYQNDKYMTKSSGAVHINGMFFLTYMNTEYLGTP